MNNDRSIRSVEQVVEYDNFASRFLVEWNISAEFCASKSDSLKKILKLAKDNSTFSAILNIDKLEEKEAQSQSFLVSFKPEQILEFRQIYDIVKSWKGTVVRIGRDVIDKRTLSRILRCYTDKVKYNEPHFCFGVSRFTDNPFGCHRTQIHNSGYRAWFKFVRETDDGIVVDKEVMLKEIIENLKDYRLCPVINAKEIFANLLKLPNKIDPTDSSWIVTKDVNGKINVESRAEVEERQAYLRKISGLDNKSLPDTKGAIGIRISLKGLLGNKDNKDKLGS